MFGPENLLIVLLVLILFSSLFEAKNTNVIDNNTKINRNFGFGFLVCIAVTSYSGRVVSLYNHYHLLVLLPRSSYH